MTLSDELWRKESGLSWAHRCIVPVVEVLGLLPGQSGSQPAAWKGRSPLSLDSLVPSLARPLLLFALANDTQRLHA